MNFKKAVETYSIVSCSTRDTSLRDLGIMALDCTERQIDSSAFGKWSKNVIQLYRL